MDLNTLSQVSYNNSEDQFSQVSVSEDQLSLESVSPPRRRRHHQPPALVNVNPPPQGNDLENLTRAYLVSAQDRDEKKRLLQDHLRVAKEKVRQTEEVVNTTLEGRVTTNEAGDVLINMEGIVNVADGVLGFDGKQAEKAQAWTTIGISFLRHFISLTGAYRRVVQSYRMSDILRFYANTPQASLKQPPNQHKKMSPLTHNAANIIGSMEHAIEDRTERLKAIALCIADAQKPSLRVTQALQETLAKAATVVGGAFPLLFVQYPELLEVYPYVEGGLGASYGVTAIGNIFYKNWLSSTGSTVQRLQQTVDASLRGQDLVALQDALGGVIAGLETIQAARADAGAGEEELSEITSTLETVRAAHAPLNADTLASKELPTALKGATRALKLGLALLETREVATVNRPAAGAVNVADLKNNRDAILGLTKKTVEPLLLRKSLSHSLLSLQAHIRTERCKHANCAVAGVEPKHPRYQHFVMALGITEQTIEKIAALRQDTKEEIDKTLEVMKALFVGEVKRV